MHFKFMSSRLFFHTHGISTCWNSCVWVSFRWQGKAPNPRPPNIWKQAAHYKRIFICSVNSTIWTNSASNLLLSGFSCSYFSLSLVVTLVWLSLCECIVGEVPWLSLIVCNGQLCLLHWFPVRCVLPANNRPLGQLVSFELACQK